VFSLYRTTVVVLNSCWLFKRPPAVELSTQINKELSWIIEMATFSEAVYRIYLRRPLEIQLRLITQQQLSRMSARIAAKLALYVPFVHSAIHPKMFQGSHYIWLLHVITNIFRSFLSDFCWSLSLRHLRLHVNCDLFKRGGSMQKNDNMNGEHKHDAAGPIRESIAPSPCCCWFYFIKTCRK
jgi:hypothetical protein